jgi:hypothetical protein
MPVLSDPALSAEVDRLAGEIAGPDADPELRELARRIAEAEVDALRVRRGRQDLIAGAMANPDYQSPVAPQRHVARLVRAANEVGVSIPIPPTLGEGPARKVPKDHHGKMAIVLFDLGNRLAVLDRYERRALSRRKFAIRDFDEIRAERAKIAAP